MKLRNKITGEIIDAYLKCIYEDGTYDDMSCESIKELTIMHHITKNHQ